MMASMLLLPIITVSCPAFPGVVMKKELTFKLCFTVYDQYYFADVIAGKLPLTV